ncbi:MAG: hypothetical protein WCJ09_23875 [Planctomycetota bacterium]
MRSVRGMDRFIVLAVVISSLQLVAVNHVRAQGQYSPVSEANVVDLTLNHYFTPDEKSHAPDFEWTFTKTDFVVKKGKGAIPSDIIEKLLSKGATADEIRGKWKLADKGGQQLVLTEIKAGDKAGGKEVKIRIYKTAPSVVRIGEPQYVFGIGK